MAVTSDVARRGALREQKASRGVYPRGIAWTMPDARIVGLTQSVFNDAQGGIRPAMTLAADTAGINPAAR